MIVGIDPGVSGAAAALYPPTPSHNASLHEVIDLPTCRDGMRRRLDVDKLYHWLRAATPSRIIIESVGPMPADGRVAAFRFGMAVGTIHTICRMMDIEPELVAPLEWKGYYALIHMNKDASIRKARVLMPEARPFLMLKKNHNRAEAMLIARWGLRPPIGRDW